MIGQGVDAKELYTFRTKASPESVLAYYKEVLLRIEWKIALERPEGNRFSYPNSAQDAPCIVDVLTSKAVDGRTKVFVNVIASDGQ